MLPPPRSERELGTSIRYVIRLVELAEQRGQPGARLLAAAGIGAIPDDPTDVRVPLDNYYRLWSATMSAVADPALPLRLAETMPAAHFDALGFAVLTSATYGDALARIQRYLPFVTDGATWAIDVEGEAAVLTFTQLLERTPAHRYLDEFGLAHLVVIGRTLISASWEVDEVRFRHARPPDTTALEAFFRAPLRFDAEATQLRLPAHVLELPVARADGHMAAFFDRYIESVLARTHPEHAFVTTVRRLLAESLVRNAFSLDDLARQLAMSSRTLRRRLGQEGIAYSALLEEVRRDLAETYLRDRRMSLGEIAFALGYSESATFHRAFRRWHGMTPAAFRADRIPSG
jgi:AraC-like DNA-binding protein